MSDLASVAIDGLPAFASANHQHAVATAERGDITIPLRQLLSESQRRQLLEPHFNMGQREIARYYTLSDDDLKRIRYVGISVQH